MPAADFLRVSDDFFDGDAGSLHDGCESQASAPTVQPRGSRLRFLQASDFRLDTPCSGVRGVPEDLLPRFIEARFIAAGRVFDAALRHQVDFLVLPGGLLDTGHHGLRGPTFLAEQCRRLARARINVYWAGRGLETRGRWPAHVDVPPNLHRLSADGSGMLHGRNGSPVARLVSLRSPHNTPTPVGGVFTIAVQPCCVEMPKLNVAEVDYWALGGMSEHETIQEGNIVAHFSGSPQGSCPSETGRHSCSLVDVEHDGTVRIQPLFTDVIRWHHQRIAVDPRRSWQELVEHLKQQQARLRTDPQVEVHLATWTLTGGGPALQRLLQPESQAELTRTLDQLGAAAPVPVCATAIHVVFDEQQREEWKHQPGLRGDFLRELERVSPRLHRSFASSAEGNPASEVPEVEDSDTFRQHVLNEGIRWMEGIQRSMRRAG
jgi:DNA repair protein SbcD/Mre11